MMPVDTPVSTSPRGCRVPRGIAAFGLALLGVLLPALVHPEAGAVPPVPRSATRVSAADPALVPGPDATADGPSETARFSAAGRHLVFTSEASNLVTNRSNGWFLDVFLRDLAAGRNELVSVTPSGGSGNGDSFAPDPSADGRFVAFVSRASDLVHGDDNGVADVFVRDRVEGVTRRVSVAPDGGSADGESFAPRLTPDGRWVCFGSRASNLLPGTPETDGRADVFVRDLASGVTVRVSDEARVGAAWDVRDYLISDDGGWVAFTTPSTDVVLDPIVGLATTLHVRDLAAGRTVRIDVPAEVMPGHRGPLEVTGMTFAAGRARLAFSAWSAGGFVQASNVVQVLDLTSQGFPVVVTAPGASGSWLDAPIRPVFSADGESLAWVQSEFHGRPGVLRVWNAASGITTPLSPQSGLPIQPWELALSPDGRRLAFTAPVSGLVPAEVSAPLPPQLFLMDMTDRSVAWVTAAWDGRAVGGVETAGPVFSPDGRWLAFHASAPELALAVGQAGLRDRNGGPDVFLHAIEGGPRSLVSHPVAVGVAGEAGPGGGGGSLMARGVSADGRHVLFASVADDLVTDDTKGVVDLFVRDRLTGRVVLVTVPGLPESEGPQGPGFSEAVLSGNGRHVAFTADVSIVREDGIRQASPAVFVRDLALGRTRRLTVDADGRPLVLREVTNLRIGADGRHVAYYRVQSVLQPTPSIQGRIMLHDLVGNRVVEVVTLRPSMGAGDVLWLAGLGGRVLVSPAGVAAFEATLFDLASGISQRIPGPRGTRAALRYDGRRTLLVTPGDGVEGPRIAWIDEGEEAAELRLGAVPGRSSTLETLSMDGGWVVLRERTLDPGVSAHSTLAVHLATGEAAPLEADGVAVPPVAPPGPGPVSISADGGMVAFTSRAADLVPGDANGAMDVFLRQPLRGPYARIVRTPDLPNDTDPAFRPLLSGDGGTVVFSSWSPAFAPDDGNRACDVFAVDLALPPSLVEDRDADGLRDRWEVGWFGNLLRDGSEDFDADGASDMAEFRAGTCPIDDLDRFRVVGVPVGAGEIALRWQTHPGRRYRMQTMAGVGGVWEGFGAEVSGEGQIEEARVPVGAAHTRFYRVSIESMD